jgi:hypothetical protein
MTHAPLHISIDDKTFSIRDEDQEAASLLRLAGREPKTWDLFLVGENGVEDKIGDEQIINLRDDERFVTRQKIRFTIDGEPHSTYDDDQTAATLLRLAGVDPAGYDLARALADGGIDKFSDEQIVKIKNGDEFVTAKHVGGVA